MANEEQLKILNQGVETWNAWRENNPNEIINLSGATLSRGFLSQVDFSKANLAKVNLNAANLIAANLNYADLNGAYLNGANLSSATLKEATLNTATLSAANLNRANFKEADLRGVYVAGTLFANLNLSEVKWLNQMDHRGPSTIGFETINLSKGKLPLKFLRGCGLNDYEIKTVKLHDSDLSPSAYNDLLYELSDLRNAGAIQFHSCFISYSSQDEPLAKRLYTELQENGVRCWYAPKDLKIGEKLRLGIDRAVATHEKLLLILSKASIASAWVEHEVERAFAKERKGKVTMLFPIRLDDSVMEIDEGWAAHVKDTRHIGDFREWHNEANYKTAFDRLKKDLQQNVEQINGE